MTSSHFLSLDDLSPVELVQLIDRAIELKTMSKKGIAFKPLAEKSLAMIFSKSSTRTRLSFELGMQQLGGVCINLNASDTQIGRGEPLEDTAKVISSMVDGVMIRCDAHDDITIFAQNSSVPVINGLTDLYHPCQILADLQTLQELRGGYQGCRIAWIGDGNNVCHSFMNAARLFGFHLNIATPVGYEPNGGVVAANNQSISLSNDPKEAVRNVDVVVTDTWASMGQEEEKNIREAAFSGFCVDRNIMSLAHKEALFLHCLPAYRGSEVSAEVIDSKQSVVFQEAENRLHAQKSLLEFLLV